jgi:hypothetical protein
MAGTTINAVLIDGVLIIADHPLPAEYADELIVVEATTGELEQLEAAGYGWRRADHG